DLDEDPNPVNPIRIFVITWPRFLGSLRLNASADDFVLTTCFNRRLRCDRLPERGERPQPRDEVTDVDGGWAGVPAGAGAGRTTRPVCARRGLRGPLGNRPGGGGGDRRGGADRRRGHLRRRGGGDQDGDDPTGAVEGVRLVSLRDIGGSRRPRRPRTHHRPLGTRSWRAGS